MKNSTVDVAQVIEGQKLSWFLIRLILVSWLVTFVDGYDMNVIAFAAESSRSRRSRRSSARFVESLSTCNCNWAFC